MQTNKILSPYFKGLLSLIIACISIHCLAQNTGLKNETGIDSLLYKRNFIFGKIYQKNMEVNRKTIDSLFKNDVFAVKKYRLGSTLKPIGPLVSVGGLAISYLAIKGKPASTFVEGKNYDYTIRSLPKLLVGIGSFVGGICLIEWSNELLSKSTDSYNSKLRKKKVSMLHEAKFGITPSGNVGIYAKF